MFSMCPVCNGLQSLESSCPDCGTNCSDEGRLNDLLGPYAPYRPIDEVGMDNGVMDVERHRCTHVTLCPSCGKSQYVYVQEWRG